MASRRIERARLVARLGAGCSFSVVLLLASWIVKEDVVAVGLWSVLFIHINLAHSLVVLTLLLLMLLALHLLLLRLYRVHLGEEIRLLLGLV